MDSLRHRFEEATAYDRLMLETMVGADLLLRQLPSTSIDDLRGHSRVFERTGGVSLGAGARTTLLHELSPLLFVTAWKVIDLIVELVKESDAGKAPPARGWPIKRKVSFVRTKPGRLPEPFVSHPSFWRCLAKLYERLEEPRNAIIHRRFRRSPTGSVIPYGTKQRPLRTITFNEVRALVLASYGIAEELVVGRCDPRRCGAISWQLDQLRGITRLVPTTTSGPPSLRVVRVNLEPAGRRWRLNLKQVREHIASQNYAGGFADIEAYRPGGKLVCRGRLEDAPEGEDIEEFPASTPPSWLRTST
jgi:hypothetical protein